MGRNKIVKIIAYWVLPRGFVDLIQGLYSRLPKANPHKLIIKSNIKYKRIHKGKRCFILCNGPSVKMQDLTHLKGEIVFSVSSGYHHKNYPIFKPRYHCLPQITYTEKFTKETVVDWFREMEEKIGNAELFLNYTEHSLVTEYKLFRNHKVNYIVLGAIFKKDQSFIPDMTEVMPGVRSVPIMCLMIAMYMGFKEIYLIGTDHESFRTGEYKYPFEPTVLKDKIVTISPSGKLKHSMYTIFRNNANLWVQYRTLKNIASKNNVKIFNATAGGALDEFERVDLENILRN